MSTNNNTNSIERITAVMAGKPVSPFPKGELWLGTDLLNRAGFEDSLDNHFRLVEQLGQDMICLPIADEMTAKPQLGYRYFQCTDLGKAVRNGHRFVAAVVDGPFQELVNRIGLMEVLTEWIRNRDETIEAYRKEKDSILDLICQCLEQDVHAVVITDDLCADQGSFINPTDIDNLFSPFYTDTVNQIHGANAFAFFHSCGNITGLTRLLKNWNLDGLASIQHSANNLIDLQQKLGSEVVLMAGIDAALIMSDEPSMTDLFEFEKILKSFVLSGNNLILSSSCGLYDGDYLGRINDIYNIADQLQH